MTDRLIPNHCPECNHPWTGGMTCTDDFHQMLAWEVEDGRLFEVHHLMVLCYHLQHPRLYSPDGLRVATGLLVEFLENGMTPREALQKNQYVWNSGRRNFKITGTAGAYGAYPNPPHWTMTAGNVVAGGMEHYPERVQAWACSIYETLKSSRNLILG